jgi:hypothetical protein
MQPSKSASLEELEVFHKNTTAQINDSRKEFGDCPELATMRSGLMYIEEKISQLRFADGRAVRRKVANVDASLPGVDRRPAD